jgi:hypothetical protein
MAVFKLNFEQFITLSKRIDNLEAQEKVIFPLFYYTSFTNLYIYKPFQSFVFCTIIPLKIISDLEQFKKLYLSKAYELSENYLDRDNEKKIPNKIPNVIPELNPNLQPQKGE